MGSRRRNLFVILLVLGLLAASVVVIASKPTRLGLDLKGGVELVYQGQPTPQSEVTAEAVDRSIDIMRERVDALGVSEPEIQRLGSDQVSVGLPDVQNAQRAIDQVGTTAQLYFYDFERNVVGDSKRPIGGQYEAVKRASRQQPVEDANNTADTQYYLFDRGQKLLSGPDSSRQDLLSEFKDRVPRGAEIITVPPGTIVVQAERPQDYPEDRPFDQWYVLRDNPELNGKELKNPEQQFDPNTNEPIVSFEFTSKGRNAFHDVTQRLAQRGQSSQIPGQPADAAFQTFAVVLDGKVVTRPFIDFTENPDGIDGRTGAQISGGFTGSGGLQEAQDLAEFLKIGALPINLKLINQTQISASLGKQALNQGLIAGIIGFALVLIFLLILYRLLGVIAAFALITYGVFFYALIELIPITLTLPGIAGLILTIGVAADSNIVIFERVKEELRAGRTVTSAMAIGYKRGIATIIDANVVTLITAFILFILATSGVKGFAFTLGIGTIVSLFTAVLFTQAVLASMGRSRLLDRPSMLGAGKRHFEWNFDFMGKSKYFFAMSGIIILIGALAISTKGFNFGIDFESGTRVTAALERTASVEDVRDTLSPLGLDDAKIQNVNDADLGDNVVQVSTTQLGPGEVAELQQTLDDEFGVASDGFSSSSVGPTFGETVARSAIYAIFFSLLTIMAYVAFRFEPKFAVPVLIALFHDLLITAGVYSLADREVTTSTVAALLTILGFSLYDTVIVFDRIRENAPRMPRAAFSQIVNRSMSEVLTRSLATSFCEVLPLTALLLFGGETLQDFAFALIVGIASGTYSSIFIAAPVLTAWKEREAVYVQRRRRIAETLGMVPAFAVATAGPASDVLEPPAAPVTTRRAGRRAPEPEPEPAPEEELDLHVDDGELAATPNGAELDEEPDLIDDEPEAVVPDAGAQSARAPQQQPKKRSKQQRRRKHGRRR